MVEMKVHFKMRSAYAELLIYGSGNRGAVVPVGRPLLRKARRRNPQEHKRGRLGFKPFLGDHSARQSDRPWQSAAGAAVLDNTVIPSFGSNAT